MASNEGRAAVKSALKSSQRPCRGLPQKWIGQWHPKRVETAVTTAPFMEQQPQPGETLAAEITAIISHIM